jgi:hypothetical protein
MHAIGANPPSCIKDPMKLGQLVGILSTQRTPTKH